jgi:hypothetical protein
VELRCTQLMPDAITCIMLTPPCPLSSFPTSRTASPSAATRRARTISRMEIKCIVTAMPAAGPALSHCHHTLWAFHRTMQLTVSPTDTSILV